MEIYEGDVFRALRGSALRQANDEWFADGTGPRAAFEAQQRTSVAIAQALRRRSTEVIENAGAMAATA